MANLRMIDNLIVSPDTSALWRGVLTWLQNQEASGLKQWLIFGMLSLTEWSVSNVATRILIHSYTFRITNKKLFCHYTCTSVGTPDTSLRNPGVPQNPVWETLVLSVIQGPYFIWHCRFSFPAIASPRVWAVGWVGYVVSRQEVIAYSLINWWHCFI
jgi:hypothetical protein